MSIGDRTETQKIFCRQKQNSLFPLAAVIGCGRTERVNRVWLKILNNLTRLGYNKITGLYFMSDRTKMGNEVDLSQLTS